MKYIKYITCVYMHINTMCTYIIYPQCIWIMYIIYKLYMYYI